MLSAEEEFYLQWERLLPQSREAYFQKEYFSRLIRLWPYLADERPPWLEQRAISGYSIVDCISNQSRFARVFRAIADTPNLKSDLNQLVCLKIGNGENGDAASVLKVFQNEANILQRLNQHGVGPQFIAADELHVGDRSFPCLMMEYVRHLTPLSQYRFKSLGDCCQYFRQLFDALDEIHRLGIVHCDLHPENVFVQNVRRSDDANSNQQTRIRNRPVILDFNVARFTNQPADVREFGPPIKFSINEQYFRNQRITRAFDIACLSVLIEDQFESAINQDDETVPFSTEQFDAFLNDCRQYSPELRPQNCMELSQQFEGLLRGDYVQYRPTFIRQAKQFARSNPMPMIVLTAMVFFVVTTILTLTVFLIAENDKRRSIAIKNQELEGLNGDLTSLSSDLFHTMDRLLDITWAEDQSTNLGSKRQVRLEVADLLRRNIKDGTEDRAALVGSLKIARNLALAHLDVDSYRQTRASLKNCLPPAQRALKNSSQLQLSPAEKTQLNLIVIQLMALDAYVSFELAVTAPQQQAAFDTLCRAAKMYTEVDTGVVAQSAPSEQLSWEFLNAGYLLGYWGFYPQTHAGQRTLNYSQLGHDIFDTCINFGQSIEQLSSEEKLLLSQIYATYGRCLYKHLIKVTPRELRLQTTEKYYAAAIELSQPDENDSPKVWTVHAYAKNLSGQYYKARGKYELAIELSRSAFQISRKLMQQFPGSRHYQREFVTNGWNYADIYYSRRRFRANPDDNSNQDASQEIEIRTQVVEVALEAYKQETSRETKVDLAVNLERLVLAHAVLDNRDEALRYASLHIETVGYFKPGHKHGLGLTLLVLLLLLVENSDDPIYQNYFDTQLEYVVHTHQEAILTMDEQLRKRMAFQLKNIVSEAFGSKIFDSELAAECQQKLLGLF